MVTVVCVGGPCARQVFEVDLARLPEPVLLAYGGADGPAASISESPAVTVGGIRSTFYWRSDVVLFGRRITVLMHDRVSTEQKNATLAAALLSGQALELYNAAEQLL